MLFIVSLRRSLWVSSQRRRREFNHWWRFFVWVGNQRGDVLSESPGGLGQSDSSLSCALRDWLAGRQFEFKHLIRDFSEMRQRMLELLKKQKKVWDIWEVKRSSLKESCSCYRFIHSLYCSTHSWDFSSLNLFLSIHAGVRSCCRVELRQVV